MPSLLFLSIDNNTKITDTGLQHLKSLKSLTTLNLTQTKVTAQGIADLQKALPKCRIVHESLEN